MHDPLRIGLCGSGFIARTHAHAIARYCTDVRLTGIAGGTRAAALAADFQVPAFPDVEALAASDAVDAVIVTTPHALHHRHALLCARGGKHVLLEKPMAASVPECLEIIDACHRAGVTLMVAFTQRFRRSNQTAYDIIRSGRIGRILSIQEYALLPNGLKAYPAWQQRGENLGILFGYGIHNIDRLRWFLEEEPESVAARLARSGTLGIETTSFTTLQYRSGAIASIWSSVDLPAPGFPATGFRSLIVGERGLIDLDGYGEVRLAEAGTPWQTLFVQPPIDWRGDGMFAEARMGSFAAQDQSFVDAIRSRTPPPVTGEDGLRAVAIALAAYESAATGQTVILPTP